MVSILRRLAVLGPRAESPSESISEVFHENTKISRTSAGISSSIYKNSDLAIMARGYKHYRMHHHTPLPLVSQLPYTETAFDNVIANRRSARTFSEESLDLMRLAKVLHNTYGITGQIAIPGGGVQQLRAAPSAGALYPAEIYLGVRHVDGLDPGIYHYFVPGHALELLRAGNPTDRLSEICFGLDFARRAAVAVLISAVMGRTKRKYGERGYRYVLFDVGHLAQNLYLASVALRLSVVAIGGFVDDEANNLLYLDGIEETIMYVAFIGPSESI